MEALEEAAKNRLETRDPVQGAAAKTPNAPASQR